jgi:hypothetical protein
VTEDPSREGKGVRSAGEATSKPAAVERGLVIKTLPSSYRWRATMPLEEPKASVVACWLGHPAQGFQHQYSKSSSDASARRHARVQRGVASAASASSRSSGRFLFGEK